MKECGHGTSTQGKITGQAQRHSSRGQGVQSLKKRGRVSHATPSRIEDSATTCDELTAPAVHSSG